MELRHLEAFVTVATELHFSRAADRLYISASTLSDLIRGLESELRTPLFVRTTRRVELTAAGVELLGRAKRILGDVADAERAVVQIAAGNVGTVRLGVTPPAGPVLAAHLTAYFAVEAPMATVTLRRMWLPDLTSALNDGRIDVAVTCGDVAASEEITTRRLCGDRLLVGLRAAHRLADREDVDLHELAGERLGMHPPHLFPAWYACQQHALSVAGVSPPTVELIDTDLVAGRWMNQPEIDWILLISSLSVGHDETVIKTVHPTQHVPFTISWVAARARASVVDRFVRCCLQAQSPPGWIGLDG